MQFELNAINTMIVAGIGVVLGVVSSFAIHGRVPTLLWAGLVSLIFVAAAMGAVFTSYSWMFNDQARILTQEIAVVAALTGIVFSMRSRG